MKHVILLCGCASDSLSALASPLLPYLRQLSDEILKLPVFDVASREEMLMKVTQEVCEGHGVSMFDLYQLQRLLPCWTVNTERLTAAVLKSLVTFNDMSKNNHTLKDNALQFVIRLLWILTNLPVTSVQFRDLFFCTYSIIATLSSSCSALGSLDCIVMSLKGINCSTNL